MTDTNDTDRSLRDLDDGDGHDCKGLMLALPPPEEDEGPETLPPEHFHVHDTATASWVVRKVVEARAYGERVKQWAARELSRARRDEESLFFRFGAELRVWADAEIVRRGGRRKSVNLPSGQIGFRHEAPKLVLDDADAVLAWAREHCMEAVVVAEKVSKSALDKHFEATGEVPPRGAHVTAAGERFYIR